MNFTLNNTTTAKIPEIKFLEIKNAILGKKYSLSLVFTSAKEIKKLNTIYRNKKNSTDILSFPLSEIQGEIYISLSDTKLEAKKFARSIENFLAFLFIHGCVHLKGYDHGDIMENIEITFRRKFNV